jgi:alpha-1,3-rhamnosyl/mannosyltransferase
VLTISNHARASIVERYGVDPDRISVAPPAVDPIFGPHRREDLEPVLARYGIERPYVVAIGGARRRGLEVAVDAWRKLPRDGDQVRLVAVGPESPPPAAGLIHVGRVDDATWSTLLAGATALCYPTRFEGYGMPALEAAASGVPVVCAPVGPLPEVLGDAAQWCDDPSVPSIATGLRAVVTDRPRREQLAAAGLARAAASPTWADAARTVLKAYERTASG